MGYVSEDELGFPYGNFCSYGERKGNESGDVIKLFIIQLQSGIMYITKNGFGIYMATIKVICPYCKSDKVVGDVTKQLNSQNHVQRKKY